jgi:hypothetical protein
MVSHLRSHLHAVTAEYRRKVRHGAVQLSCAPRGNKSCLSLLQATPAVAWRATRPSARCCESWRPLGGSSVPRPSSTTASTEAAHQAKGSDVKWRWDSQSSRAPHCTSVWRTYIRTSALAELSGMRVAGCELCKSSIVHLRLRTPAQARLPWHLLAHLKGAVKSGLLG